MKYVQFLYHIVCLLILTGIVNAQKNNNTTLNLNLSEAIERSLSSHLSLKIQETAVEQARGQKQSAGKLPNPILTYYREDLSLGGVETGEWIVSGQLPLNFLWERWTAVSAASARIEVEKARLSDVERELIFEVKKAFIDYIRTRQLYNGWQQGVNILDQVSHASKARLAEGDISGYEYQRISLELQRYKKYAAEATAEWSLKKSHLAYLTGFAEQEANFEATLPQIATFPTTSLDNCISSALNNRPDLKAAQSSLQSRRSLLNAEKWRRIPETSLSIGYKEQNDNFSGPVVQFNIGIPLFDRNQGRIKESKAIMHGQALHSELLKKRVILEVRNAYNQYQIYRDQYQEIIQDNSISPERLLQTAQTTYQEGEASLIQLLDALQAYIEAIKTRQAMTQQYYLSVFELEKVAAIPLAEY